MNNDAIKLRELKRILVNDLYSYITFNLYYKFKIKENSQEKKKYKKGVTVVITSCGRPERLREMINSLLAFNTYEIEKYILVEDANCTESVELTYELLGNFNLKIIKHYENIGQLKSIDEAYSYVETEYILHLEEDWIFIKSGFIEYSIDVFEKDSRIVCLSLRPHSDWSNLNFIKKENFNIYEKNNKLIWKGIAINPGLYKKNNYDILNNYSKYKKERIIVQAYYYLGFIGAISNIKKGYIYHAGEGISTRKKYKVA